MNIIISSSYIKLKKQLKIKFNNNKIKKPNKQEKIKLKNKKQKNIEKKKDYSWLTNFLYFSAFLFKISSIGPITLLKEFLSRLNNLTSVLALTLAALGWSLSKANSPK